jgi:hypothetical protein
MRKVLPYVKGYKLWTKTSPTLGWREVGEYVQLFCDVGYGGDEVITAACFCRLPQLIADQ